MIHLHLPDAWRIHLMHDRALRCAWLDALEAVHPAFTLVDWSSPKPVRGDLVLFPRVDLASAELIAKLDPDIEIAACRDRLPALPLGGRAHFRRNACARVRRWVHIPGASGDVPRDADAFLRSCSAVLGRTA